LDEEVIEWMSLSQSQYSNTVQIFNPTANLNVVSSLCESGREGREKEREGERGRGRNIKMEV